MGTNALKFELDDMCVTGHTDGHITLEIGSWSENVIISQTLTPEQAVELGTWLVNQSYAKTVENIRAKHLVKGLT